MTAATTGDDRGELEPLGLEQTRQHSAELFEALEAAIPNFKMCIYRA